MSEKDKDNLKDKPNILKTNIKKRNRPKSIQDFSKVTIKKIKPENPKISSIYSENLQKNNIILPTIIPIVKENVKIIFK